MKKLLEAIAPVCCIYDVDLETFVEVHELRAGESINTLMSFMLEDPVFNVRRDSKTDNVKYDIFTSEGKRYIERMLGDVMKTGARSHMLWS